VKPKPQTLSRANLHGHSALSRASSRHAGAMDGQGKRR
jgi:hypothetical protein